MSQEKPHEISPQGVQPKESRSQPDAPQSSNSMAVEPTKERIYERSSLEGPLRQGEILTNIIQLKLVVDSLELNEGLDFDPVIHPYAIIVTQDCDVIQDFAPRQQQQESDKIIPSILFCEATTAEGLSSQIKGTDIRKRVKQNKDERYQFLEKVAPEDDALGEGLPELGVDFKRYFTLPTEEVYFRITTGEAKRRCRLVSPYLQNFSSRFYYFQNRVALPAEHRSE